MTIIPWEYYLAYGDSQLLAEHYEAIKKHTDFLASFETRDGTIRTTVNDDSFLMNLGEHAAPFSTPSQEMIHTYVTWTCSDYTSRIAKALGNTEDERTYEALANKIAAAFHAKFYDAEEGTYGPDECDVLALRIGVPESERSRVIDDLNKRIGERGNHIVTGFIASRVFFEVLSLRKVLIVLIIRLTPSMDPSVWRGRDLEATCRWISRFPKVAPLLLGGLWREFLSVAAASKLREPRNSYQENIGCHQTFKKYLQNNLVYNINLFIFAPELGWYAQPRLTQETM